MLNQFRLFLMQGSIRTWFLKLRLFESAAHWRSGKISNQLVV